MDPLRPNPFRAKDKTAWWRTISARIVLLFASLFLIVMILIQSVGLYGLQPAGVHGWIHQLTEKELHKLSAAADASKAGIETWIRERRNDLLVFAKQPGIVEHLRQFRTRDRTPATLRKANEDDSVAEYLALIHDTFGGYESILLIDARSGIVVAASESERIGTTAFDAATLPILTASGAEETLAINASEGRSRTILRIFRQVIDPRSDAVLGLFVVAIDLEGELRNHIDGMLSELRGTSGEVLLYDASGRFVLQPRYPLADGNGAAGAANIDESRIASLAVRGGEGQIAAPDYRGEPVLAAYRYVRMSPEVGWGLVVKKDESEVLEALREHNRTTILLTVAGIVAFLATAIFSARGITRPIRRLIWAARRIEAGDLSTRAGVRGNSEIADLAQTFNAMVERVSEWHEALDTQVRQQTRRILEQEGTLVAYSQATNDAIITIDENGQIVTWNPAAERTFGYSADEAIGRDLHRLLAPSQLVSKAESSFRNYIATGTGPTLNRVRELPALTRSGKTIAVELTVSPIQVDGKRRAIGTLRDITERKRFDNSMRVLGERLAVSAGEDYFRSLAAALAEAVGADSAMVGELLQDQPPQISTLGRMTQTGLAENCKMKLIGTPGEQTLVDGYLCFRDRVREVFPQDHDLTEGISAWAGQPLVDQTGRPIGLISAQWRESLADGFQPAAMLKLFASRAGAELERLLAQRELAHTLGMLEQRVAERTQELTRTNSDLETTVAILTEAKRELVESEKLASLGRLVAGVAHELNTPIGNSLTVSTSLSEKIDQFRRAIAGGTVRRSTLNELADDLDHGARLLASGLGQAAELIHGFKQVAVDQTSSQRRSFDLRTVIDEVMATLHPRLKKTTHRIVIVVDGEITLDSYPGPFGQIITNLVENAFVHAFDGLDNRTMRIAARQRGTTTVEIEVSDDGCGMSAEVRERVFDPFFTTRLGRGGSGLGMNIVYNIVTGILGGKIALQSAPRVGTTYLLTLPLTAPSNAAPAEKP